MALTGIQIYKHLPKTNCKECGFPTCLAFAMKLAQKQVELDKCPYVSDEAKALLAEESAPAIRKVIIGTGEKQLEIGEETVLFRHEKTFVHPPGFTLQLEDTLGAEELAERAKQAEATCFERVGQQLRLSLIMVKNASQNKDKFTQAVNIVQQNSKLPLILASQDAAVLEAALEIIAAQKPLIYAATEDNYQAMAGLAKKYQCPLAIHHSRGLDKLAELAEAVAGLGVNDLVLDPGVHPLGDTLAQLTQIRRAALKKSAKGLGFPVMVYAGPKGTDPIQEVVRAAVYVMKYAAIIVLNSAKNWQLLPLLTLTQNIYTDPQQPLQVEEKVYKIGEPTPDSPVLITTNFSLTYFIVAGEIENSKIPCWLLIADAEGMSVLTAWAADKFNADKIAKVVNTCGIKQQTRNHRLIIPGAVAVLSGEVAELLPDWEIVVGPREAGNLPTFLKGQK
jgi:acetyl-CoA decarbonylase/synthase complex subunit gamma